MIKSYFVNVFFIIYINNIVANSDINIKRNELININEYLNQKSTFEVAIIQNLFDLSLNISWNLENKENFERYLIKYRLNNTNYFNYFGNIIFVELILNK